MKKLMHDRSKKGAEKVGGEPFGIGGNHRMFGRNRACHPDASGTATQHRDESRKGLIKNRGQR